MNKATEMEALKTKKTDLLLIDPNNIVIEDDFNVRQDYGDIDSLAKSIASVGQIEPVVVSKIRGTDQYILTDGHRRMKGIMLAKKNGANIPYVKAVVSENNPITRLLTMVITGADKKPLTNLEEGEAYKRLKAEGINAKEIASRVGKSFVHVYAMMKLADAPDQIKQYIRNGEISGSTVSKLMQDYNTVEELIQVVEEAVLNAQIEDETDVKDGKKKEGAKPKKATARHAGVMSPMKKLEAALDIAVDKGYGNIQILHDLVTKLGIKESKPEQIAKLFK